MSVAKVARTERIRAETALRLHLKTCLACYRWSKGVNLETSCDLGPQLLEYTELMRKQESLLPGSGGMIQDGLF